MEHLKTRKEFENDEIKHNYQYPPLTEWDNVLTKEIESVNKWLKKYGLTCKHNDKYKWSPWYDGAFGVYQRGSARKGTIRIALNPTEFQKYFACENGVLDEDNEEELYFAARVTIWHEIGHGMIDYAKMLRRRDTQGKYGVFTKPMRKALSELQGNEEYYVEDFAYFMLNDWYRSDLDEFLSDYVKELKKLDKLPPTHNTSYFVNGLQD